MSSHEKETIKGLSKQIVLYFMNGQHRLLPSRSVTRRRKKIGQKDQEVIT